MYEHNSTTATQELPPPIDARGLAASDFARQADARQPSVMAEMWGFMRHSKKWWLTPIVAALILIGVFLILSATAAGPLIYTLF